MEQSRDRRSEAQGPGRETGRIGSGWWWAGSGVSRVVWWPGLPCLGLKSLERWVPMASRRCFCRVTHGPNRQTARAGWSAVQCGDRGTVVKAACGNVPAHLTQSAAAAEHGRSMEPPSSLSSCSTKACKSSLTVSVYMSRYEMCFPAPQAAGRPLEGCSLRVTGMARVRHCGSFGPEDEVPTSTGRHSGGQLRTGCARQRAGSHERERNCTIPTNPTPPPRPPTTNWSSALHRASSAALGLLGQNAKAAFAGQEILGGVSNPSGTRSSGTKICGVLPVVLWSGPMGKVVIGMAGPASAQGILPKVTSVLVGGRETARPGMLCMRSGSGEIPPRCCANQQSLPRRLMHRCSSFLERKADVRLRRMYGGHPTRAALFDGILWPLCLAHHARRALSHGAHGVTVATWVWSRAHLPIIS